MGVLRLRTLLKEKTGTLSTPWAARAAPEAELRTVLVDGFSLLIPLLSGVLHPAHPAREEDEHIAIPTAIANAQLQSTALADLIGGDLDIVPVVLELLVKAFHDVLRIRLVFLFDGQHYVQEGESAGSEKLQRQARLDAARESTTKGRSLKRACRRLQQYAYLNADSSGKTRMFSNVLPSLALREAVRSLQRLRSTYGTEVVQLTTEVDIEVEACYEEFEPLFLLTSDTDMIILPGVKNVVFVDTLPLEDLLAAAVAPSASPSFLFNVYSHQRLAEHFGCSDEELALSATVTGNDTTRGFVNEGDFAEVVAKVKGSRTSWTDSHVLTSPLILDSTLQYLAYKQTPLSERALPKREDTSFPRGLLTLKNYNFESSSPTIVLDGTIGHLYEIHTVQRVQKHIAALLGKEKFTVFLEPFDYMQSDVEERSVAVDADSLTAVNWRKASWSEKHERVCKIFQQVPASGSQDSADPQHIRNLFIDCWLWVVRACVTDEQELYLLARALYCSQRVSRDPNARRLASELVCTVADDPRARLLELSHISASAFSMVENVFELLFLWGVDSACQDDSERVHFYSGTVLHLCDRVPHELSQVNAFAAEERAALAAISRVRTCHDRTQQTGSPFLDREQWRSSHSLPSLHESWSGRLSCPYSRHREASAALRQRFSTHQLDKTLWYVLVHAAALQCVEPVCTVVAALTVDSYAGYFLSLRKEERRNKEAQAKLVQLRREQSFGFPSDFAFLFHAYAKLAALARGHRVSDVWFRPGARDFIAEVVHIRGLMGLSFTAPDTTQPRGEASQYYFQVSLAGVSAATVIRCPNGSLRCFPSDCDGAVAVRLATLPRARFNSNSILAVDGVLPSDSAVVCLAYSASRDVRDDTYYVDRCFVPHIPTRSKVANAAFGVVCLLVANPPAPRERSPVLHLEMCVQNGNGVITRCAFCRHESDQEGIDLLQLLAQEAWPAAQLVVLLIHVNILYLTMWDAEMCSPREQSSQPLSQQRAHLLEDTRRALLASTAYSCKVPGLSPVECQLEAVQTPVGNCERLWDVAALAAEDSLSDDGEVRKYIKRYNACTR